MGHAHDILYTKSKRTRIADIGPAAPRRTCSSFSLSFGSPFSLSSFLGGKYTRCKICTMLGGFFSLFSLSLTRKSFLPLEGEVYIKIKIKKRQTNRKGRLMSERLLRREFHGLFARGHPLVGLCSGGKLVSSRGPKSPTRLLGSVACVSFFRKNDVQTVLLSQRPTALFRH